MSGCLVGSGVVLLFVLYRAEVAQGGMTPSRVVPGVDPFEMALAS